jgi:hypothetical protein
LTTVKLAVIRGRPNGIYNGDKGNSEGSLPPPSFPATRPPTDNLPDLLLDTDALQNQEQKGQGGGCETQTEAKAQSILPVV